MARRDFAGKSVLITGAGRGIGRALALEWAGRGARLFLGARTASEIEQVAQACGERGSVDALSHPLDLSCEESISEWVARATEALGSIDCLVNNAGVTMRSLFADLEPAAARELFEVNFFGTLAVTRAALEPLRRARGQVVVISSLTGLAGVPTRSVYSASKFALHGLFGALRIEESVSGLSVLLVCPGFVETGIRQDAMGKGGGGTGLSGGTVGPVMTAEDLAVRTVRAAEQDRRLLVPGRDGRLLHRLARFAPRLLDRVLARKLMEGR